MQPFEDMTFRDRKEVTFGHNVSSRAEEKDNEPYDDYGYLNNQYEFHQYTPVRAPRGQTKLAKDYDRSTLSIDKHTQYSSEYFKRKSRN